MKISYVGRKMDVGDDLKAMSEKKLSKFDKFFTDNSEVCLKFSRFRGRECLEVTINDDGTLFRGEEKDAPAFSAALDSCVEKIERQIRKNKTRLEKRLRAGAFVHDDVQVEEEGDYGDIKVKNFALKPMTPDEAILRMNLLEHEFFMFEDAETSEVCVVYKRNNGGYGMIIPSEK